ncbi:triacylglycerol lipase [Rhodococcus sp. ARC_M5]|uniref:esterase/lipase family protein n=1 Tax=Rhodococcus sp. ARC_M5 TaxID=2928851 RepID=UPI001FB44E62|nr:alpha/beta fold hydrolase [Rhodococcus sp. ARC_M5]MCJ0890889.1 lipase family protein [Rhodococcus sp. ARC_M5]
MTTSRSTFRATRKATTVRAAVIAAMACSLALGSGVAAHAQPTTAPAPPATVQGDDVIPPAPTEASPKAADQGIVPPSIDSAAPATSTYDPQAETKGYGPAFTNFLAGFLYSVVNPNVAPQGANDWNCKPSAAHPRPVVLLHGTWENAFNNFARMSPALKKEGYCVFALNYGDTDSSAVGQIKSLRGTDSVASSAKEIATYIDAVRAATGSAQVDIVGHSQGGLVTRQYLRFEGGANPADPTKNKVNTVVSVAGSNHGTTLVGIGTLGRTINNLGLNVLGVVGAIAGPAASDQVIDSPLVKGLAVGGDTDPGIKYTVIGTKYDEVVTPYKTTFLAAGPGATVNNVTLQDGCGIDLSDHLSISVSLRAIGIVKNALDPKGFPTKSIPCAYNSPITGG